MYLSFLQLLTTLARKSLQYPEDIELEKKMGMEKDWENYRDDLMLKISKTRWPVDKVRIKEVGNGGQVVLPELALPPSVAMEDQV